MPKFAAQQAAYVIALRLAGFQVLGLVARESFDKPNPDDGLYSSEDLFDWIATTFGNWLTYLQVGNEWDHISGSSWTLDPISLNNHLYVAGQKMAQYRLTWLIVLGGVVSGDPFALDHIDLSLVDIVAVHPYGQRPSASWSPGVPWGFGNVAELLGNYAEHANGKPLMVTEYGLPDSDFSAQVCANYHAAMAKTFIGLDLVAYVAFCWDDAMVAGFGWFKDGRPKPQSQLMTLTLQVLYPSAAPDPLPLVIQERNETMAKFVLGFETKALELGAAVVGDPLSDQDYLKLVNGDEVAFQFTSKGVLLYSKKANKVHFIAGK